MTRHLFTLGSVVALAPAASACAGNVQPSGSSSPDASTALAPLDLRYTCGAFPFGPGLLTAGPGKDEQANDPAAAALRTYPAGVDPDIDFLPDTGWHLTEMDARVAEFVTVGDALGMKVVSLENGVNGWKVAGWGDCQPRIELAEGLGAAEWAFDPAQPKPDTATQVFDALVTEMNCNGGQPAGGSASGTSGW